MSTVESSAALARELADVSWLMRVKFTFRTVQGYRTENSYEQKILNDRGFKYIILVLKRWVPFDF